MLADCYEGMDEKGRSARVLKHLARLRSEAGDLPAATTVLTRACRYDPGSAELQEQLALVHQHLENIPEAQRCLIRATQILNDNGDFEAALELCHSGLALDADCADLRRNLVNAHIAAGNRQAAVTELIHICAAVEAKGTDRQKEEIYRKILQLDSSRREYLVKLERLMEESVRRKKRLRAIAVVGAAVLVLAVTAAFVGPGGPGDEEILNQAWSLLDAGKPEEADKLAKSVIVDDPDSDLAIQLRNLQAALKLRMTKIDGPKSEALEALERAFDSFFSPAADAFGQRQFDRGFEALVNAAEYREQELTRTLLERIGDRTAQGVLKEYENDTTTLLSLYRDHLSQVIQNGKHELAMLKDEKFAPGELDAVKSALERADKVRHDTDPVVHERNAGNAEVAEYALLKGKRRLSQEILKSVDELRQLHADISERYHTLRATIRRHEIYDEYTTVTQEANDLKYRGELTKARATCSRFLMECDKFRREQPAGYYAPVAELLFGDGGLDLDGKISAEIALIDGVTAGIAEAEQAIKAQRHEEANALFRSLIRDNFRIDFRNLIQLALCVETVPTGAEVSISWNDREEVSLGLTTEKGLLVRYPPYGTTVVRVRKATFEPVVVEIVDFTDEHTAAPLFHLKKEIAWQSAATGPLETDLVRTGDRLLLAGRDGHLRELGLESGEPGMDHNHGLLSGFVARPLIIGNVAWLASLDQHLLAFDLVTRKVLLDFSADAPLRTAPVEQGGTIVVADERGAVYGIRDLREAWRVSLPGRIHSDPVASSGSVYLGTSAGHVVAIDTQSGEAQWTARLPDPIYAPLTLDNQGRPVVATDTGKVYLLDRADGTPIWSCELDDAVRGRPSVTADALWIATLSGGIYHVDAKTGEVRARISSPYSVPVAEGPLVTDDCLYLVDTNGRLNCLDLTGSVRWRFELDGPCKSHPLLIDGRLYVASTTGTVYSFQE